MTIETTKLLDIVLAALDDKKAVQIDVLDVRKLTPVTDYYLICHGNSDRQVQAIVTGVKQAVYEAGGMIKRIEGYDVARWVLVDLGDVVLHVFHRDERSYYNLERLWADAGRMERV
jgi:ribosome-associated protein